MFLTQLSSPRSQTISAGTALSWRAGLVRLSHVVNWRSLWSWEGAAATHVTARNGQDPTKLSVTGIYLGQTVIAVFAVLTISEEYGTGMIRVTLAAIPHRLVLLAAKAANLAGLAFVAGLLAVAGCILAGRLMLPPDGLNPAHGYALVSISYGPTLRAAVGSVLYLVLIALSASASPPPYATPPYRSEPCSACSTCPPSSLRQSPTRYVDTSSRSPP